MIMGARASGPPHDHERARGPRSIEDTPLLGNLHQRELAGLDLVVAELAVEDVALLVEVARPRGTGIVDLAAGHDLLDAVDGVVDLLAARDRRLADVLLDRLAGR